MGILSRILLAVFLTSCASQPHEIHKVVSHMEFCTEDEVSFYESHGWDSWECQRLARA